MSLTVSIALGLFGQVDGILTFANMFQGGAVLQRGKNVSVWGSGASGGVTLYLDGKHVAAAALDSNGGWTATLPPHMASFNNELVASSRAGNSSVSLSFGDVLLCSGQSNMDMPLWNKLGGFQADNGTAEVAAASRYTGGIFLWKQVQSKYHNLNAWETASSQALNKIPSFSALCWYTGRSHYDHLGGKVPVGLLQASVSGSPIEYWLSAASLAKCEVDKPQCDTQYPDSTFHDDQIVSLQPFTLGAIVWDQAERDVNCNHQLGTKYSCMQRELAQSWRKEFRSAGVPFVVVQLPDYANPKGPEGVFAMRLDQEAGLAGAEPSALVATYDQSCNNLAYPEHCPFGSVHNVHKQLVAKRVGAQLARLMLGEQVVTEGPRAQDVSASASGMGNSGFDVTVRFAGGTSPFAMLPTRNCTTCCAGKSVATEQSDFDVSHDGSFWVPGHGARMQGDMSVVFHVDLPHTTPPTTVRYTAGSNFTQCAVYNAEVLPALPFQLKASMHVDSVIV